MTFLHIRIGDEQHIVIAQSYYEQAEDFDPDAPDYILNQTAAEQVLDAWAADTDQAVRGWEQMEDTGGTYIMASAFGGDLSFFHWYCSLDGGDETYSTADFGWSLDCEESEDDE